MSDFSTILTAFTDFLNTHPHHPRFQGTSDSQTPSGGPSESNPDQQYAMDLGNGFESQGTGNASQDPRAGFQYDGMPGLSPPNPGSSGGQFNLPNLPFQVQPPKSPWLPDQTSPWSPNGNSVPTLQFPHTPPNSPESSAPVPTLSTKTSSQYTELARAALQKANGLTSPNVASRPTDTQLLLALLPAILGHNPSLVGKMINGYQQGQGQELDRQNAELARQYRVLMNDYHQNLSDSQSAHQDELAQHGSDIQNWLNAKSADYMSKSISRGQSGGAPSEALKTPPTRKQILMSAFPILSDQEGSDFADRTNNFSDHDSLEYTTQQLNRRRLQGQVNFGTPERATAAMGAFNQSVQTELNLLMRQRGDILGKYGTGQNGAVDRSTMTPYDRARLADVGNKLDELANSSVTAMRAHNEYVRAYRLAHPESEMLPNSPGGPLPDGALPPMGAYGEEVAPSLSGPIGKTRSGNPFTFGSHRRVGSGYKQQ